MELLSVEGMKQYQIAILDEVNRFCIENGIKYFLVGGSLIGAIRHKGYIPWDDDIDIAMFRNDYERFIDLFNSQHTDYHAYSIRNDAGYNYHFCKISLKKSLLIETDIKVNDLDIGINIDLFPLDVLPNEANSEALLIELHRLDKLMYGKAFRISKLHTKPLRQQILILVLKILTIFMSKRFLGIKQEQIAKQFSNIGSSYCSIISCHFKNRLPYWQVTDFLPMECIFEGRSFFIPKGYDSILRQQFGEYMELPPKAEQITHHTFKAWKDDA